MLERATPEPLKSESDATEVNGGLTPPPAHFDKRKSAIKLGLGGIATVVLLVIGYQYAAQIQPSGTGTISVSDALVCLREGADLYFNVTLGTEPYLKRLNEWENAKQRIETTQVFAISANTHVGAITKLDLDNRLFLQVGGQQYPAVGKALATTKHHNTYLAYFPKRDMQGDPIFERDSGSFRVIIQNVGKLKSRIFKFDFPLPSHRGAADLEWTQILMLVGAVLAALLISCTPCLVGTLALGAITMSTVWRPDGQQEVRDFRREMKRKTAYFLAAIVLGYLTVAIAVGSFDIPATALRPIEILGGIVLVSVGISLIRELRPATWMIAQITRVTPRYGARLAGIAGVGPAASSAMGGSLAMLCSVAGAPTLATSIILPVMVYAGMTDLTWAFAIMAVFLIASAVPFFFIAVGLGEILYSVSTRRRPKLLLANSVLLIMLGTIMMFNGDELANIISAPAELVLNGWQWITT